MNFESRKTQLLTLGITSLVCSRVMFLFFNDDPEGPNLLVVTGMAAIIYMLTMGLYVFSSFTPPKKLLATILLQITIAICFYCLLK
jgi:hypothetical protein